MKCRWCKGYSGGRRQPRSVLLPKRHCSGYSNVPKAQERSVHTFKVSCSCLANVHMQLVSVTLTLSLQHMLVTVCYWLYALMPLCLLAAQSDPYQIAKEK